MRRILTFFGLMCIVSLTFAQEKITIKQNGRFFEVSANRGFSTFDADDILYWVGEGDNSAVVVFEYCNSGDEVGVAYGFKWDGAATIGDMLNAIDETDDRFTFSGGTFINNISYQDDNYDLSLEMDMSVMYTQNGVWCNGLTDALVDGAYLEFDEWSPSGCDLPTDNIVPVPDPNGQSGDATILQSQILFWVGEGDSKAIFIANWCEPEKALAWGVKFNYEEDNNYVKDIMDSIVVYDSRFSYDGGGNILNNIYFTDGDETYDLSSSGSMGYIMYNVNGTMANFGFESMVVNPNDVIKVGHTACAEMYGDWNDWTSIGYNWYTTVEPVSDPNTTSVEDATIDASEIVYWIGEGENEVVFAVNWCEPATALAWGVRFNGTATVENIMDAVKENDSRFSYEGSNGWLTDITYQDDNLELQLVGQYWMYNINGVGASLGYSTQTVANGDIIKWGDESCGTADENWNYAWTTPIVPVTVPADTTNPEEPFVSPFSTDDITFWVGEGENEATAIFYWCQDISAGLVYGYRWNGTTTLGDMLNALKNGDSRLTIDGNEWINSYSYNDVNYNMHLLQDGWLLYSINGDWDAYVTMNDEVHNGDVFQMKDYQCEMSDIVFPVSNPNAPDTLFDGMVNTPGCQAIYFEDEGILGWATNCTIERGWQDIATKQIAASFGTENDAVGASSLSTMECVSLGDGGVATLTFDIPIQNGDGYDFAVFENSLNGYFLELAFVEVSSDGEHFVRFPATSNTQTASQIANADTVEASKINNLAGKYLIGWGTPFDLQELAGSENLDINNVTHVRVVDVVGSVNPLYATRDQYGRLINDPYPTDFASSGFDLSGVAVMNGWKPVGINQYSENKIFAYPNPCTDLLYVSTTSEQNIELYNVNGQLIDNVSANNGTVKINVQNLPAGLYMIKIGNSFQKILKK